MYGTPYGELEIAQHMAGLGSLEVQDDLGELELAMDGYGRWVWKEPRGKRGGTRGIGRGRGRRRGGLQKRKGGSGKILQKARMMRQHIQKMRQKAEELEANGQSDQAEYVLQEVQRLINKRYKFLYRAARKGGKSGRMARKILQGSGTMQTEELGERNGPTSIEDVEWEEFDGWYDDFRAKVEMPGAFQTAIYGAGGAFLAHAVVKGSKKKKKQAALYGAGAGILLSMFMGGKLT
tara:strand:+ start:54 stop:758 length:705 start_codon:yes stop_codon:yes gene_type:complete